MRSKEIKQGVKQVLERRAMFTKSKRSFLDALKIDDDYRIAWAVASESSIGPPYVQTQGVSVVQTRHLLEKMKIHGQLLPICDWLEKSEHLPIEGAHYRTIDTVVPVGPWSLRWYGIKGLVDEFVRSRFHRTRTGLPHQQFCRRLALKNDGGTSRAARRVVGPLGS
jgi:hypothetical protein